MEDPELVRIRWIDDGRELQNPPDPRYPDGIDLDGSGGAVRSCTVKLPHPARRCGRYLIECEICGIRVMVTTAGRRDDPRLVKIACLSTRHTYN